MLFIREILELETMASYPENLNDANQASLTTSNSAPVVGT